METIFLLVRLGCSNYATKQVGLTLLEKPRVDLSRRLHGHPMVHSVQVLVGRVMSSSEKWSTNRLATTTGRQI